jgi:hypothetical protein
MRQHRTSIEKAKSAAFDRLTNTLNPLSNENCKNLDLNQEESGSCFIDKMYNLDYKDVIKLNGSLTVDKNNNNNVDEMKDLNYFDEILLKKVENNHEIGKNVSINDVKDFNYIDKMYFKPIFDTRKSFRMRPSHKFLFRLIRRII